MKTKEFKQAIKDMGLGLEEVYGNSGEKFYEVYFIGVASAQVSREISGKMSICPPLLQLSSPRRRQLLGAMMDYTETPIEDREEHRWNVIIGRDDSDSSLTGYAKTGDGKFWIDNLMMSERLRDPNWIFSDDDFEKLINCLRSWPNNDALVKIAELGKIPAPEADE